MSFHYGQPDPIAPGIVRVVAKNPSPFTFKGTNTYMVGTSTLAVIDPGPEDEAHLNTLLRLAEGRKISHILITHAHRDHCDGARYLSQKTGAPIAAFGRKTLSQRVSRLARIRSAALVDYTFSPDMPLHNEETLESEDWKLKALHTPGHAPDHLCFALDKSRVLFTGDHVMAWNTTVVAPPEGRMSDYIASLEVLLKRRDRLYLPGHGGRLESPLRTVKAYLAHRQWREQAILAEIRRGSQCVSDILEKVYPNVEKEIQTAARFSILAHVECLAEKKLITYQPPLSLESHFFAA
ncbi:MAG: MBL fold metallo-hydrolase [Hyphomicrobium sp.]